jgi:tetratricopeptide (TPR) repeat protein
MDQKPRLTLAMIVREAEKLLPSTIGSVASIVDEIVVVDTGSRDGTIEVARHYGAQVFHHPWADDFSAARNACLAHVSGEWILWLDAGETLAEEARSSLRQFIEAEAQTGEAYALFVQTPAAVGHVSGEQVARIRLAPNRPELRFTGRVRESLLPAMNATGVVVEALDWCIMRTEREHDVEIKKAHAQRDLQLADLQIAELGSSVEMVLARADALATLGRSREAIEAYRTAIVSAERSSTVMLEAYYGLLSAFDANPADAETQLATCLEALDVYPLDAQLLSAMGGYMLAQNRPDLALRSYTIAVEHGRVDPLAWHLVEIGEVCVACLSLTHQLLGADEQALDVLDAALDTFSESARLRRQLINLHIKHGRSEPALEEFELLPADTPHREALRSAVRGGLLAAIRQYNAAIPYLLAAYRASCRDPICLRWLVVSYLATDNLDSAEPLLREWSELDPGSAEVVSYLSALAEQRGEPGAPKLAPASTPNDSTASEPSRQLRVDAPSTSKAESTTPGVVTPNLHAGHSKTPSDPTTTV